MTKTPVAVLGATGAVGQRFVSLLADHPWFEVAALVASDRSVGKPYADAAPWIPDGAIPAACASMKVEGVPSLTSPEKTPIVFSGLPGGAAGPVESDLARRGFKVFTNARDHRMDADVPLLIPEVNADHLDLVKRQQGPGWIVANGNCTAIILTLPLAALHRAIGVEELHVTSMQALSGAGAAAVAALDVTDNILPHIAGEEEKLSTEPTKTLGRLEGDGVVPEPIPIHATCTRVGVREGHFESVHLRLKRPATLDEVRQRVAEFRGPPGVQGLPSAPKMPIHVLDAPDRPQPRRDREAERGMAVSVGRLRLDPDGRGLRFVVLGSNTVRGAAGQSILNAEYARAQGFV
jgi:aspartate-semialdehyde dehydrogenase